MSTARPRKMSLAIAICVAFSAILACSIPFSREAAAPTETVEPTATATATDAPKAAPEPSQTAAPAVDTATKSAPTSTTEPTATLEKTPTLAPTHTATASHTPRPTSTSGAAPTVTPEPTTGNEEPLSFTYQISWRLKDESASQAIATVNIFAMGGGGDYTYYRDDLPVQGPNFEYEWGTCSGNPGSFRVDSADGQSVRIEYFENPPCPTPTPTPQRQRP